MTMPTTMQIALYPWYVFAAVWLVSALWVKRTKVRERSFDRLITMVVVIVAYELLFSGWLRIGILRQRFVPEENSLRWTGFAISCVGVSIAVWARCCLGANWSARVTLKEGHQLIRSGPYRFVRHPIYTGMLVAACGTALIVGEWRGLLAIVLLVAAHSRKALREEALLAKEFGEEYLNYRRTTGFLFPLFGLPGMDIRGNRS